MIKIAAVIPHASPDAFLSNSVSAGQLAQNEAQGPSHDKSHREGADAFQKESVVKGVHVEEVLFGSLFRGILLVRLLSPWRLAR